MRKGRAMSFETKLKKYAKLIVKAGLNVQKDQIVVIDAPVESVELVRLITKEAYQTGAKEVVVKYHDEVVSRYKYEYVFKYDFSEPCGVLYSCHPREMPCRSCIS